jgi:HlyD family secretion protein
MKRSTWALVATGSVAVAALLAWAFAPRPVPVSVARASIGAFETAIEEEGRTRVRERHVVAAPLSGRLWRITLQEGDAVEAGAVLARIDAQPAPLQDARALREARARVAVAQAAWRRAGTQVEAAQVTVAQADNAAQRSAQLRQDGFVSSAQADADRLSVLAAQRALQIARDGERLARQELDQARAGLAPGGAGGAEGGQVEVRAPVAGRVLRLIASSQTPVSAGAPLLELADLTHLEVVAELLTADAARVTAGAPARLEDWGGIGALAGRVRRVEPAAYTKVSALGVEEQRVEVLIDLQADPAGASRPLPVLGDGWRVRVRLPTLQVAQALTVPVSAVFPWPQDAPPWAVAALAAVPGDEATRMGVFVIESGRARLRPLHVGARNGALAWVRGGLAAGETVVVYPSSTVADGVRVTVREGV